MCNDQALQVESHTSCLCISEELFELVKLSEVPIDKLLFKVVSG